MNTHHPQPNHTHIPTPSPPRSLAAGQVNNTDNTASRPATPKDTFLYGSGTKPFTAAAVLRLVEEGKVNLDDPVSMHVDPVLKKDGTSWAELFGTEGAAVTVGLMLQMRSGIKDYDGNQFDDLLLYNQSSAMTSPVAFIKCVQRVPGESVCVCV